MASDGDPPLPETDDPFVLLGITEDADDKQLKQAYAKLIRRFRPDRAPSQFQRIHAAFEQIKQRRSDGPTRFELREARPAEPAPVATPESDERAILERMRAAWSAPAERAALVIDELLDARTPLDVLMRPEVERFLLLRHPRLGWTRLRRASSDLGAVLAVWQAAWDDALRHDPARAFALLDDEMLRQDAADHVAIAHAVLSRIAALGWQRLASLSELFTSFANVLPRELYTDYLLDSVMIELAAARSVADLDGPVRWLVPLFVAARIGTRAERIAVARALHAELLANPEGLLAEVHHLQRRVDLGAVFELIYHYLPARHWNLAAVPEPVFARLSRRLQRIGRQPNKWLLRAAGLGASALVASLVGVVPVAAALGAAGVYFLATEERRYRRAIRPALARAIARYGVTPEVIARWVQLNGGLAGRLWRYEPGIRNDAPLYAFAMFAAVVVGLAEDAGGDD